MPTVRNFAGVKSSVQTLYATKVLQMRLQTKNVYVHMDAKRSHMHGKDPVIYVRVS